MNCSRDGRGDRLGTTSHIFLSCAQPMDWCTFAVVWMSVLCSLCGVTLDLSSFLELGWWHTNQIRSITPSNRHEKRWNLFNSTEVCNKEHNDVYWRCVWCMECSACACERMCRSYLGFFSNTSPPVQFLSWIRASTQNSACEGVCTVHMDPWWTTMACLSESGR